MNIASGRRSRDDIIAIDGKTARGAKGNGSDTSLIHIVSAWSSQNNLFLKDMEYQSVRTVEKDHGRVEVREYYLTQDISWMESKKDWPGLKTIGMVVSHCIRGDVKITDTRYFIASIGGITESSNTVRILLFYRTEFDIIKSDTEPYANA